ncbi:unnamed protein product, partial [marine sediment metagenome]
IDRNGEIKKADYGVINVFTQYLVDHYGKEILIDSLPISKKGISSLEYALAKNGFEESFSQIFTDWTIVSLLNDCLLGPKYCYLNENLKELRIVSSLIFLPISQDSAHFLTYVTKNWSGNWYKIIGGKGNLKVEFKGAPEVNFKVPYMVQGADKDFSINFLELDINQKGTLYVSDFGEEFISLILLPSIQTKYSGFDGEEPFYQFSFSISFVEEIEEGEEELIKKLLAQIE